MKFPLKKVQMKMNSYFKKLKKQCIWFLEKDNYLEDEESDYDDDT